MKLEIVTDEYGIQSEGVVTEHGIERYCHACGNKINIFGGNWLCSHDVYFDEKTGEPIGQKSPTIYFHSWCAPKH